MVAESCWSGTSTIVDPTTCLLKASQVRLPEEEKLVEVPRLPIESPV